MSNLPSWADRYFVGFTKTTAAFVQPARAETVTVQVDNVNWITSGAPVFIQDAGHYTVESIIDANYISLLLTALIANEGEAIALGARVTPSGPAGDPAAAYIATTTSLALPSGYQRLTVGFDTFLASINLEMPEDSNDGDEVCFIDSALYTNPARTVTYSDPDGLKLQDPDTGDLVTSLTVDRIRNLTWKRTSGIVHTGDPPHLLEKFWASI